MALKDLKEASEKGKVTFGLKEILKSLKGKKSKSKPKVFVVSDARDDILKKLETADIEAERIKTKKEVSKELGLDFECEVFSI